MATHEDDTLDVDTLDVLEFNSEDFETTTYRKVSTVVDLLGEEMEFHRPKDGVLFFLEAAIADTANDADRWMSALRFLESSLRPQDRKRFLDRACDRSDPLNASALWDTIGGLLRRWDPKSKVPSSQKLVIEHKPDPTQEFDPIRVKDESLRLDFVAHPPKDIILGFTSSAIAAGASPGQQAYCVNLFLDGALDPAVALDLSYRLNSPSYGGDPLDLSHLLAIVRSLSEHWYSGAARPNRAARRAQASQERRKAAPKATISSPASAPEEEPQEEAPKRRTRKAKDPEESMVIEAKVKPAPRKAAARSSRKKTIKGGFEE